MERRERNAFRALEDLFALETQPRLSRSISIATEAISASLAHIVRKGRLPRSFALLERTTHWLGGTRSNLV